MRELLVTPLFLTWNSVSIAVHAGIWTVLDEVFRFSARGHVRTVSPSVALGSNRPRTRNFGLWNRHKRLKRHMFLSRDGCSLRSFIGFMVVIAKRKNCAKHGDNNKDLHVAIPLFRMT